jgi:hypothetical protein
MTMKDCGMEFYIDVGQKAQTFSTKIPMRDLLYIMMHKINNNKPLTWEKMEVHHTQWKNICKSQRWKGPIVQTMYRTFTCQIK